MKEFNQMVSQNHQHQDVEDVVLVETPTWAKIVEPIIAIAILWVLIAAVMRVFG